MEIQKKEMERLRRKHNLSLILLHGSQVDKKIHNKSDVDIAVVRKDRKQKLRLLELIKDLVQTLKTDRVDLSDITNSDPLFLFSVVTKSSLLAGKREDYDLLLKEAFHKYNDYKPFLKMEMDFVRERLKSYVTS